MKIGIIREGKIPVDRRVALTPVQCTILKKQFPNTKIVVQKSPLRCYKDSEYETQGFEVKEDMSDCDVLLGIKEVPINELLPQKTYFFFSHTIKKQPYNRDLLFNILNKRINMIDYETLVDDTGIRVIAFGRYAGLVGAYNGVRAYGLRYQLFDLKPAYQCFDLQEMRQEFKKVTLPNVKIVLTGGGRVARGAMETLDGMGIKKISPTELLSSGFTEAVYAQLNPEDYHQHQAGKKFQLQHFFDNPAEYTSTFQPFTKKADLLIAGAYWDPASPVLFTKADARSDDFNMKVIADITCDIEGSIPSTKKPSTIEDPFYDYMTETGTIVPPFSSKKNISVMAVDNLPNELPRDASQSFGEQLLKNVLPNLLQEDKNGMLERATIAKAGKLTARFNYLHDYVNGK